jgi:hypothetical protein
VGEFSTVAKELNLSQDAAQKVIDELAPKLAAGQRESDREAMEQAVRQVGGDRKVDKEFGGEKLNENLAVAKQSGRTLCHAGMRALLNLTTRRRTRAAPGWATTPRWCAVLPDRQGDQRGQVRPGGSGAGQGRRATAARSSTGNPRNRERKAS